MALVTCPECGREKISDTAVACPDCGYGIKKHFSDPFYQISDFAICPVCGFSMSATLIKDCRHCGYKHENLHIIPFQLKEWNELIKSDEYHDYVKNLSSGELFNEELFQETLNTVRRINFSKVHVFPYSERKGTKSERLPNKIPTNIKKDYVKKLKEY